MKYFYFLMSMILLVACGPDKETIALRERVRQDSINNLINQAKQEGAKQAIEQKKIEVDNSPQARKNRKIDDELENPTKYLNITYSIKQPLIGRSYIQARIINDANYVSYKNINLSVKYLTEDKRIIKPWEHLVNGSIGTNSFMDYRFDLFEYGSDTKFIDVRIKSAKGIE